MLRIEGEQTRNNSVLFAVVSQPKGDWKPEDYASVGELVLDISINLARRWDNNCSAFKVNRDKVDKSRAHTSAGDNYFQVNFSTAFTW